MNERLISVLLTNKSRVSSALFMFCSDDGGVKADQLPAAAAEREDAE